MTSMPVAATAIILREGKILLVVEDRDDPRTGKRAGMMSSPAGWIQEGEASEQTAQREVLEETGFSIIIIRYLEDFSVMGHQVSSFLGELISDECSPSEETLKVLWMPIDEFLEFPPEQIRPGIREGVCKILSDLMSQATTVPL